MTGFNIDAVQSPLGRAFLRGDNDLVAEAVSHYFSVTVEPKEVAKWPREFAIQVVRWSYGTWMMWFRNRITFRTGGGQGQTEINFPVELHIFFTRLEETYDMWVRLRRDATPITPQHAYSKVSEQNQVLRPIDRTAARVAPTEKP